MAKKILTKEEKVKKEIKRLKDKLAGIDENLLSTVDALIRNAAFTTVTLDELQETINEGGCISVYKNGENQYGTKKSPEVEVHIAMTKNLTAIMKQLSDIAPPAKRKDSRLAAMREE